MSYYYYLVLDVFNSYICIHISNENIYIIGVVTHIDVAIIRIDLIAMVEIVSLMLSAFPALLLSPFADTSLSYLSHCHSW